MGASNNCVCTTCLKVVMGEARPSLLRYHGSDGTAAAGRLPVATKDYGPLVHRHIVVVYAGDMIQQYTTLDSLHYEIPWPTYAR
jgi:hypothetical protein